jgi:hypothetical protein
VIVCHEPIAIAVASAIPIVVITAVAKYPCFADGAVFRQRRGKQICQTPAAPQPILIDRIEPQRVQLDLHHMLFSTLIFRGLSLKEVWRLTRERLTTTRRQIYILGGAFTKNDKRHLDSGIAEV